MEWFLLIQRNEMVPGMAIRTPIGGGHRVPAYRATRVLGPFETAEEARTAAARQLTIEDEAVLFQGEQIQWNAIGQ